MAEPLLAIDGLQGGYGDVRVLWGVDLSMAAGDIACLVGSNGAGKTTLLRAISGVVQASAGSIRFAGSVISDRSPRAILDAGIAHVPEGRRLFAAMSVRDNLLMGAYRRESSRAAIARDLDRMFTTFPILAERAGQAAGTLSGGEQQMCAIARGMMSAPRLLLIDELSLGLAPRIVDELVEALRHIHREGVTILVVEQDAALALEISNRAFVMDSGRITRAGASGELKGDAAIREAYLGTI